MNIRHRLHQLFLGASLGLVAATAVQAATAAAAAPVYGPELEGFEYPHPVKQYNFTSQGEAMHMAYMDVAATGQPNGRTVVLLHGKNYCAATWGTSITALSAAGYRVIAPDQIGFCKSTKPMRYQYTFQQLAANTHALLESIGIKNATIMGHSTGGMIAVRYGLMYPGQSEQLVLANPIGLEDGKALGIPSPGFDKWYANDLNTTDDRIRSYQKSTYFVNQWKPEYEPWVQMLAGMYRGPGKEIVSRNSAQLSDMIYTQPVVYEFPLLKMPVLLLIGTKDTTATGKDYAPPELRPLLGRYDVLGKEAARRIPHSTLVEFDNMGHAPQMQDPVVFHAALLKGLAALPATRL